MQREYRSVVFYNAEDNVKLFSTELVGYIPQVLIIQDVFGGGGSAPVR